MDTDSERESQCQHKDEYTTIVRKNAYIKAWFEFGLYEVMRGWLRITRELIWTETRTFISLNGFILDEPILYVGLTHFYIAMVEAFQRGDSQME